MKVTGRTKGLSLRRFRPSEYEPDAPLKHIRLDKALEYLIGDKLK